ncbi:MAG: cobalamin B12-binding domain-containing protein [Pseudomonadota bacterium]
MSGETLGRFSSAAQASLLPSTKQALVQLFDLGGSDCSFRNFVRLVIAPAARELGEAWVDDRLAFADVTVGMARLQTAVQKFKIPGEGAQMPPPYLGRVFMASLIDTQHTLGAAVAARAFGEAGWDVIQLDRPDLADAAISFLRANPVDLIALGVGTTERAGEAQEVVERLRSVAPRAKIYLGGPAVFNAPELFEPAGADILGWDVFDVARWDVRSVAA